MKKLILVLLFQVSIVSAGQFSSADKSLQFGCHLNDGINNLRNESYLYNYTTFSIVGISTSVTTIISAKYGAGINIDDKRDGGNGQYVYGGYINCGTYSQFSPKSTNTGYTVMLWGRSQEPTAGYRGVICNGQSDNTVQWYIAKSGPDTLLWGMYFNNWGGNTLVSTAKVWVKNQWSHVAMTWDKKTGRIKGYWNGVLISDQQEYANDTMVTTSGLLGIGLYAWYTHGMFRGDLDDIAIYNRALSQGEIKHIVIDSPHSKQEN